MKTRKIAYLGLLIALAFIFSYVEFLIPVNLGIPGAKLGLANLVIVVALYTLNGRDAFLLSMIRIVLVGFTFGNMASMLYSLAGGIMSFAVMAALKKLDCFSILGVSIAGGVCHNIANFGIGKEFSISAGNVIFFNCCICGNRARGNGRHCVAMP